MLSSTRRYEFIRRKNTFRKILFGNSIKLEVATFYYNRPCGVLFLYSTISRINVLKSLVNEI